MSQKNILKFDLRNVESSFLDVQKNWKRIDDKLELEKLGRRDTFDCQIRGRMMDAYRYIDTLLMDEVPLML